MKHTRFMQVLFSAVEENDEMLAAQVAKDIEDAKANGSVDTDEVMYEDQGNGKVAITDKENGEVTIAERVVGEGGDETYELHPADVDEQLEGYLHPEGDGVTPGAQQGELMPDVSRDFLGGQEISEVSPEGMPGEVEMMQQAQEMETREFSFTTKNVVVRRIFSDQQFCERLFSEVIESEETVNVGDLKIEKDADDENAVVVTSNSTGDQAKVVLEDNTMEVMELDSKNFNEMVVEEGQTYVDAEPSDEQFMPVTVVGIDPMNNVLVDAPAYGDMDTQELIQDLTEQGVEAIQVFENQADARDYAFNLISNLGVETTEDIEPAEEVLFSDRSVYLTKFYSNTTGYMTRLFSEAVNDVDASQSAIEDAIESGEQVETESEIITPVDSMTAIVEDKQTGEFTKISIQDENMELNPISEEEVNDLTENLVTMDDEAEEKEFSEIYCDEAETKFFSAHEEFTNYMTRLFSEEADQELLEQAIESGEVVDTDQEVITPIGEDVAIIEDKETGEFTKAILGEEDVDVSPLTEDEAEDLIEAAEEVQEKEFSEIYCDEAETKFFSAHEEFTNYMTRLFSEEADQEQLEKAIESGEQVETESEIITPVAEEVAIVEDKETGEFTKAILDEEGVEVLPISEEEADELTEGLSLPEKGEDLEEKGFSDSILNKFFSDILPEEVVEGEEVVEEKPTLEAIEDKALAAIESIRGVAEEATQAIVEAKEAPVENAEEDLKEATFSNISETGNEQLMSWLDSTK